MSQDQPLPESVNSEPSEGRSDVVSNVPLEEAEEKGQGEQREARGDVVEPVPLPTGDERSEREPLRPVTVRARSTPARRPSPPNDEILPQTLLRLLSEAIVAVQPPLKQQGVKALRGTIRLLETAVERLDAEPAPKQIRRAPAPEMASEKPLPPSSRPRIGKLAPLLSTATLREKFRTVGRQLRQSWRGVLRQLRDRLPASINRTWSDQALTGAIVGMVVLLLWTTSTLLPDQPQPTTIATSPPGKVAPSPAPTLVPMPTPTPLPPLVKAPEAPPVEISPSPVAPSPLPPPLKLTPEQTLIARIQNQVGAISNQYANGLVQSIQANFRSSRLLVYVSDGWYGLSRSQQDQLAGELLSRTQELDFSKLELVDGAGSLLARSPVVGAEMIILKRANKATAAA